MRRIAAMLMVALAACTEDLTRPAPGPVQPEFAPGQSGGSFGIDIDIEKELGLPEQTLTLDTAYVTYQRQLQAVGFPQVIDTGAVLPVYRAWFRDLVLRKVASATHDARLYSVAGEYWNWRLFAGIIFGPDQIDSAFAAQIGPFRQAASAKFHQAILGNLKLCRDAPSLNGLANAIFWLDEADRTGVFDAAAFQYDYDQLEADIRNGCAVVVLSSMTLPDTLEVGVPDTLRMNFKLDLGTKRIGTDARFQLNVEAPGALLEVVDSLTDAFGHYEQAVIPQQAGPLAISTQACLVLPGRDAGTPEVCLAHPINRVVVSPPPPPPPPPPLPPPPPPPSNCGGTFTPSNGLVQVFSVTTLNAVVAYEVIEGFLFVQGNDSLVTVEFPCLKRVTGALRVDGNRRMTDIAFPQLTEVGLLVTLGSNPVLLSASFPVLQVVGAAAAQQATPTPGLLSVSNNPALFSLTIGPVRVPRNNVPSQGGGISLVQPLALPDWGGLSLGIQVDTLFFTLPAPGVPGFTLAHAQAYKLAAPGVLAVCELVLPGGARNCL